jgi:hypothetical protein
MLEQGGALDIVWIQFGPVGPIVSHFPETFIMACSLYQLQKRKKLQEFSGALAGVRLFASRLTTLHIPHTHNQPERAQHQLERFRLLLNHQIQDLDDERLYVQPPPATDCHDRTL